jgi:hypothetical protein
MVNDGANDGANDVVNVMANHTRDSLKHWG